MRPVRPGRRAFSLVELLVVASILVLLVGLLVPATHKVRQRAARITCGNNLKQVGLALHGFHDARGHFPHGTYNLIDGSGSTPAPYHGRQDRRCWVHDVLPYLEHDGLYRDFDRHMDSGGSALAFAAKDSVLPVLMCPADPASPKSQTYSAGVNTPTQGFSGNYVVCAASGLFNHGSPEESAALDGVCYPLSRTSLRRISDGTSSTALLSELILSPDVGGDDVRGRYYNPAHSGVAFSTLRLPNSPAPDRFAFCASAGVPNAPCDAASDEMIVSARSYHSGGVNVVMADGSLRFVSDGISTEAWRPLGSRSGKEPVPVLE